MKKDKWTKIGVVAVDSGQLVICDPTYIDSEWKGSSKKWQPDKHNKEFSYQGCSHATIKGNYGQLNFDKGHAGAGVAFTTGLGDGLYDVFAKIENVKYFGTRVTEVRIKLL
jgi:hypothetical protein